MIPLYKKEKVSLLDQKRQIEQKLGSPDETKTNDVYGLLTIMYKDVVFDVSLQADEIFSIEMVGEKILTARGAHLGMTRKDIGNLYGTAEIIDKNSWAYIFTSQKDLNKVPKDFILLFSFNTKGIVTGIVLYSEW